jgi:glucuronoarabinoxylan endo-1,4-beta-xylanase
MSSKYFYIGLFFTSILALSPAYGDINATGQVNASVRHQTLEGFGASNVWSGYAIVTLGDSHPEIYDIIFGQLGLDILRLRNPYLYNTETGYINRCAEVISEGRARTGRPLKIMISSWSPSADLKSNGKISGGGGSNATLAKDVNPPYNYVYDKYAKWWADSLTAWDNSSVHADYICIQNEPDIDVSYDSCRFDPNENPSIAGYNKAFEAVYQKLYSARGPNMPKMLPPETMGFGNSQAYIDALIDVNHAYGFAHHLYSDGSYDSPDDMIPGMQSYAASYGYKPLLQTEYCKLDNVTLTFTDAMNLALSMHNSLTVEGVSAYLYWELTYTAPRGLVSITSSSWTINPVYWAFKHYSAFTDPNWQRIDASTDSSNLRISAYISPDNNQLSAVIINTAYSTDINLALSFTGFNVEDGNVYRTTQDQNCVLIGDFNQSVPLSLPRRSITTIALSGTPIPTNCQDVYTYHHILPADLTGDCYVDFNDVQLMAEYWLATSPIAIPPPEHSPDIHPDSDNRVNLLDFAVLSADWLNCNNPQDSNCIKNW